jgi:tetratricopeptide (TPR) repeat protein
MARSRKKRDLERDALAVMQSVRGLVVAVAVCVAACRDTPPLEPMPPTDTAAFEASVRSALREAQVRFDGVAASRPSNDALGAAYGDLAMTCHAQDLIALAEVAYRNARRLAPDDRRWPHLLGHLYLDSSRVKEAIEAFEAAHGIDPRAPATVHALATAALRNGEPERARALFASLASLPGGSAAAATGLGKAALAVRDHRGAITHLEQALSLSPGSSRLRQPLSAAYRAIGNIEKAALHQQLYSPDGAEPEVEDAAADALAERVVVSKVLLRRGQRAARAGHFDAAEKAFRATIAADPGSAEAHANLGITLANQDRLADAQRVLEKAVRMDPPIALAHFSLAVVHDRQDHLEDAIAAYQAALRVDPGMAAAQWHLADALMRSGDAAAAAMRYEQVLRPRTDGVTALRHALAVALVRAGRHAEARRVLERATQLEPDDRLIVDALARVLATSPEARVRDGRRAVALACPLHERTRTADAGEACAMALAQAGRHAEAAALQRSVMAAGGHDASAMAFMSSTLERYEHRLPAREAWRADHPVFRPKSGAVARRVP